MDSRSDRLTIVVGASRGIGRHLAERAAMRGDALLACARDRAALASIRDRFEAEGVELAVGDFLASEADLGPLAEAARSRTGPTSILVTAATIGPVGPLTRVAVHEWIAALDANVGGAARLLNALVPALSPEDLLVFFSGGGVGGPKPQPNVSAYTTSKAALMHLVEVAARENPDGPTIVSIAPGAFPTGFTDPVTAAPSELAGAALLADVARTRSLPFDASDLDRLLDYLEAADRRELSGRTLSARRDTPDLLTRVGSETPDLYRLRRVDGVGVTANAW